MIDILTSGYNDSFMRSKFESRPRRFVREGVFLIFPLMKLTFALYLAGSIVMKAPPLQLSYLNTYHDRSTGVLSLSDIVYFLTRSVSLSLFLFINLILLMKSRTVFP